MAVWSKSWQAEPGIPKGRGEGRIRRDHASARTADEHGEWSAGAPHGRIGLERDCVQSHGSEDCEAQKNRSFHRFILLMFLRIRRGEAAKSFMWMAI